MFDRKLMAAVVAAGLTPIQSIVAAEAEPEQKEQQTKDQVMEEVLVTGKRGVSSAQNLAQSVTAFGEAALERLDVLEFDDLIVQTPGTNFIDNGGPGRGNEVASIRGLSPVADNTVGVVAQYLDGAPRFGRNYKLFDIGEVAVLRGPQGTLWGAQSIGGLISFHSNRPDLESFDGTLQFDSYSTRNDGGISHRLGGYINIPVIEGKFAVRVAGHTIDESGYIDNATTGEQAINQVDESAWRVSALYTPTDETSITVIYHGNDLQADASTYFDIALGDLSTGVSNSSQPADQQFDLVNIIIDTELEWANFNYTGSYFDLKNVFSSWADSAFGTAGLNNETVNDLREESWTHEFRLVSNSDSALQWVVGIYYDDLEGSDLSTQVETLDPNDPSDVPAFAEGFELFVLGGPEDFREKAIFGELTYDFTDQWQLLIGGRYFDWEVDNREQFTFFGNNLQQETGVVGDADTFFKAQVTWRPTDDMTLFLTRSEGFRIGGFNPFVGPGLGIPVEFLRFGPDTLVNYEFGVKSIVADGRIVLNSSFYFMEWDDIQTVVRNESETFAFTANAGKLEAKGFEVEMRAPDLFIDGFYLGMNYGYTINEFTEAAQVFPAVNRSPLIEVGDRLRRTPKNTWSVDAGYDFAVNDRIDGYVRANYWHKDETTTEGFNGGDGMVPVPAQNVVNMSAGLLLEEWQVKLYVDNVTDKRPLLQIFPSANGLDPATASTIRPRTVGVEFTYNFAK